MRTYYPIWEQLKLHKKASVVVVSLKATRLIKAVKKEKNFDLAFKFEMLETLSISYKIQVTRTLIPEEHRKVLGRAETRLDFILIERALPPKLQDIL